MIKKFNTSNTKPVIDSTFKFSDLPKALLSNYKFFDGLSGGQLLILSSYDDNKSNINLSIENFKVKNAPGVVKLLSLADFGGLADLAEGEGLSFEKLEIMPWFTINYDPETGVITKKCEDSSKLGCRKGNTWCRVLYKL